MPQLSCTGAAAIYIHNTRRHLCVCVCACVFVCIRVHAMMSGVHHISYVMPRTSTIAIMHRGMSHL